MTALAVPDLSLRESFVATVREFQEAGEHHIAGSGIGPGFYDAAAACGAGFEQYVATRLGAADLDADHGSLVPCEYFWIIDDDDHVVGFLALRLWLNAFLLGEGGHIGYAVRPTARRLGHASGALELAVLRAAELGMESVLLTCDEDNLGSARTIEGAGGVLEDVRHGKRRYWIPAAARLARPRVTRVGSGAAPS